VSPLDDSNYINIIDRLMHEPELQEFVDLKTGKEKVAYELSDTIKLAVDRFIPLTNHEWPLSIGYRFYFSHYCLAFRNGKFAQANSTMYVAFQSGSVSG
jgi:hypothetical protein